MNEPAKIVTKSPTIFPHGWKSKVAQLLNIHPNTVKEALKRGENDPTYIKIMHTATQHYSTISK